MALNAVGIECGPVFSELLCGENTDEALGGREN
jgi:hypothetical protein